MPKPGINAKLRQITDITFSASQQQALRPISGALEILSKLFSSFGTHSKNVKATILLFYVHTKALKKGRWWCTLCFATCKTLSALSGPHYKCTFVNIWIHHVAPVIYWLIDALTLIKDASWCDLCIILLRPLWLKIIPALSTSNKKLWDSIPFK